MFSILLGVAFAALTSLHSSFAISINTPTDWKSGQDNTVTWTSSPDDPDVFTIQLRNDPQFNNRLALANNVLTSLGSIDVPLPPLAEYGDVFTLEFVNITNIDDVYATSSGFSILEQQITTTAQPTSTTTTTDSASTTATGPTTTTRPTSGTPTTTTSGSSTATNAAQSVRYHMVDSFLVLAGIVGAAL